jgi:hypothetical protein
MQLGNMPTPCPEPQHQRLFQTKDQNISAVSVHFSHVRQVQGIPAQLDIERLKLQEVYKQS